MEVKDIIWDALRLVGRADVAEELETCYDGDTDPSAPAERLKNTFFTYLKAVTEELAYYYVPFEETESVTGASGKFYYGSLTHYPIRIKRVYDAETGRELSFLLRDGYFECEAEKVTVRYDYAPSLPEFYDDEFYYPGLEARERLVEYGMAAEHCLVMGDAQGFASWEKKYREEIDRLQAIRPLPRGRIAPRRWI